MSLRYSHIGFLMVISATAFSQDLHNGSSIFIPDAVTLYFDDFNNTGFIQNNGTIETTGDWKNENVYQGLGTVILAGENQEIDNNDQAVRNLLIDGGGMKSLLGKLSITGSIDFASGVVKVGSDADLVVLDGGSVEGGSRSSYVDGSMTIEGTGYKFFPVGRGNSYHPFTLTDVRGLEPIIQVTIFENLPDLTPSRNVNVDHAIYWTQKTIGGRYDGSPVMVTHGFRDGKIAFVSGNDLSQVFQVTNGDVPEAGLAVSREPIQHSIIAIGTLPPEPVLPGYLSTTLSPNAQNPDNRLIKLFGTEMSDTNFSFRVFNRFGSLLFESASLSAMTTDGWDGKYNGQFVSAGAYPYKLSYVDHEGREGSRTGFITVIY